MRLLLPLTGRTTSRRPVLAPAAAAAALALVLAGCGSDTATDDDGQDAPDPLAQVEVVGEPDAPVLEVEAPLTVAETEVQVLEEGAEDERVVEEGDLVTMDVLAVSGGTGDVLQSTFTSPTRLGLLADTATTVPGLVTGVVGQRVGSRVLVGVAPEDFPVQQDPSATTTGDGSVVLLIDIESASAPLAAADGEPVAAAPEGLPAVTRDQEGAPTIAVAEGEPPAELRVETLVQGTGEEVVEGDTVAVRYTGVVWGETEPFDSAWVEDRPPFVFAVGAGQVIPAWDQGLQGVAVGSQVMVVAPPDLAYGDAEQGAIPAGSTLVFVVDVLAAEPTGR